MAVSCTGVGDLRKILSNVKTRGILVAVYSRADAFPPGQYVKKCELKENSRRMSICD